MGQKKPLFLFTFIARMAKHRLQQLILEMVPEAIAILRASFKSSCRCHLPRRLGTARDRNITGSRADRRRSGTTEKWGGEPFERKKRGVCYARTLLPGRYER
jgi:hypothetical protein